MKVNELRIGNLILISNSDYPHEKGEWMVSGDTIYLVETNDISIEGIPLTEDWLLKAGFQKINASGLVYFNNGKLNITTNLSINYDAGQRVYLKYVHQLQNLYHALTGEELQITEK